jgi:hypothetical protein
MANNIASFFEAEPDASKGAKGVAEHLKNFWDTRMRREILTYADEQQGDGLKKIASRLCGIIGLRLVEKKLNSKPSQS